jgi:hypothetical protein
MDLELLNQVFRGHDRENEVRPCVLKKCLMIQCAKLGLDCLESDDDDIQSPEYCALHLDCHVVIVNTFNEWEVDYCLKLQPHALHTNPALPSLVTLFDTLREGGRQLLPRRARPQLL